MITGISEIQLPGGVKHLSRVMCWICAHIPPRLLEWRTLMGGIVDRGVSDYVKVAQSKRGTEKASFMACLIAFSDLDPPPSLHWVLENSLT